MRRLAAYVLGTLAALGALELAVRAWEPLFAAASDRVLTKAAILDRHGPVDVLFFGSSRTWDGVSPRIVSAALEAERPGTRLEGFNLASTATSLEALEYLAGRFAGRPGLRLAVIELSEPQLKSLGPHLMTPFALSEAAAGGRVERRGPSDGSPSTPPTSRAPLRTNGDEMEGRLAAALAARSRLVAHRKFLAGENLARLPALLFFAPRLDGSEVKFAEQLVRPDSAPDLATNWLPARPGAEAPLANRDILDRVIAVAERLRAGGARVAFAVPPLARAHAGGERTPEMRQLFAAIAESTGAEVWDYSGVDVPAAMLRGTSHLNAEGRRAYSSALAAAAIRGGLVDALQPEQAAPRCASAQRERSVGACGASDDVAGFAGEICCSALPRIAGQGASACRGAAVAEGVSHEAKP